MPQDYISVVEELYNNGPEREWQRLERHRTEYAVTLRVLADHLPPAPARILDCGGGPGRYAIELSTLGYDVTLFDLSKELLDIARLKSIDMQVPIAGIEHGSATDLSRFAENSFDAVLLMGPLYHLLSEENRRLALQQAYRVAKPGAPIFAAFINRYAAHRDAAAFYPELLLPNAEEYEGILEHGCTFPIAGKQNFVAYFAHPDEIEPLCRRAGLEVLELVGVEGLASMCEEKLNVLDGETWDAWVDINHRVGKDRSALGNTEHILAVCRKPVWHQVLYQVIGYLDAASVDYCVVGSMVLALHGLVFPINDIDLDMPLDAARQFQADFAGQCTRPLEYRESDFIRSYWGSYSINGINIDVMAELEFMVDGRWVSSLNLTRTSVQFQGRHIKTVTLEEETLAYIRRGRFDRAALALPHCDVEQFQNLLRRYQERRIV